MRSRQRRHFATNDGHVARARSVPIRKWPPRNGATRAEAHQRRGAAATPHDRNLLIAIVTNDTVRPAAKTSFSERVERREVNVKTRVLLACFTGAVLLGSQASAAQVFADEEKGVSVNVGVLLQPQMQITAAGSSGQGSPGIGAPDGKSPSLDFFARRIRLMAWGSVTKSLSYFVETDQPNFGKAGDFTSSTYIQDAFLTYTFAPEFKIDAGMMLVPFSRHTIEGAVGLNAIDYHAEEIRLPAGKVWRDTGVQFRGLVADNLIHYRLGVFEGARNATVVQPPAVMGVVTPRPTLNDSGMPRFTGQLRLNVLGSEPDFFLKGIYFSAKPLVSIGVGADLQPKGVYKLDGAPGTYAAFSFDAFAELPLTADDELIAKANVFIYGEGASFMPASTALPAGGTAFFAEAGFRHEWIEPLAYVEYLQGKNDTVKILAPHAGVNFWVTKHTFNVKADVGYRKTDTGAGAAAVTRKDILGTVQAQLFF